MSLIINYDSDVGAIYKKDLANIVGQPSLNKFVKRWSKIFDLPQDVTYAEFKLGRMILAHATELDVIKVWEDVLQLILPAELACIVVKSKEYGVNTGVGLLQWLQVPEPIEI